MINGRKIMLRFYITWLAIIVEIFKLTRMKNAQIHKKYFCNLFILFFYRKNLNVCCLFSSLWKTMYFQMLLLILDQGDTKVWIPYFSQCAKNISLLFLSHANLDLNIQYSSKQFTYT